MFHHGTAGSHRVGSPRATADPGPLPQPGEPPAPGHDATAHRAQRAPRATEEAPQLGAGGAGAALLGTEGFALWKTDTAMENGPFINDFPNQNFHWGFSLPCLITAGYPKRTQELLKYIKVVKDIITHHGS